MAFDPGHLYASAMIELLSEPGQPIVVVVGAGPAGLMAAEVLARGGAAVTVFDRMPSPGRKFLLAGRGGLNLTHVEDEATFHSRYGSAVRDLRPALAAFGQSDLRAWCDGLGIATFVGTSGRIFPASFKTSPLLRAWLRRLDAQGVRFMPGHRWTGWRPDGALAFETAGGTTFARAAAAVLALGGASWPQLGSDGLWTKAFADAGIAMNALAPANCGFAVAWTDMFRDRFEGVPIQNVALSFEKARVRGDVVVTRAGLEGGALYALGAPLRAAIAAQGKAVLHVALRPDLSDEALVARLGKRSAKDSLSNGLRKSLNLSPAAIGLLREAALHGTPLGAMDAETLAAAINALPITLTHAMPIAKAISTAGGVRFDGLEDSLMLRGHPGTFVAGEMLDWEAPTGGYLLQACFATGALAGRGALAWLEDRANRAAG